MLELERVSEKAIPAALDKAVRYRLLNEPMLAESICLDILAVEPDNQEAAITLLLALTDQFSNGSPSELGRCRELLPGLKDEYERAYYAGIIAERRATALLDRGGGRCGHVAYDLFREAVDCYERARELAPADVDDAVLRRNTCIRLIERHPHVRPAPEDRSELMLE
jgi:hypothetical protein